MSEFFDPFEEMKRFRKGMKGFFGGRDDFEFSEKIRQPLIDVVDKGKTIEVVAELPGTKKENINLNVKEDALTISAKTSVDETEEKKWYYHHERSYSQFSRLIPLPAEIKPEKTKADFNNGILTVTMEKKGSAEKPEKGFKVKID